MTGGIASFLLISLSLQAGTAKGCGMAFHVAGQGVLHPHRGGRPRVRSTLDFAALHDHARLPARFFGRILAVGAAGLAA
jgi:hypothetical protein